ncbi:hypothetical protein [Spirulina subsalsa]|uniref:hypothetical protein n=1 Tax=Spirulina subsalsa TaxID=54311 RepID=UPI0002F2B973|nr:hypothetical protein [Spirulina subsalsa]
MTNFSLSDNQVDLLKSFLVALSQQKECSLDLARQLREIAQNLVLNIERLDGVAQQNSELQSYYKQAYSILDQKAAERGVGLDFVPNFSGETAPNTEVDNTVPDSRQRPTIKQVLNTIDSLTHPELIQKSEVIFQAENPLAEFYQQFGMMS